MVWALLSVGALGLVLGLRFRAPALLTAAFAIAGSNILIALVERWSVGFGVISTIVLLITLQVGYLAGLLLASSWLGISGRGR